MAGTTPILGLPYPDGSDPISSGDDVIRSLTTKLDGAISRGRIGAAMIGTAPAAGTGLLVQAGSLNATTNAFGDFYIDFPVPFVSVLATVVVTNGDGNYAGTTDLVFALTAQSLNQALIRVWKGGAALVSSAVRANWIAVGL